MNNLLHNHNIVAKVYAKGKISLPTTIKNDLGLHDGDNVIFIKSGNSWMITTRNVLIKDAQNLAEAVNSVLVKKGGDEMIIWNYLGNFVQYHYPLDDELSFEVIKMTKLTKPLGLSLGDRYCIALGKVLNIPIYTADRAWKQLEENLNVTIELIR